MIQNNWLELIKPERIVKSSEDRAKSQTTLVVEPLEKGFGLTLGTALRRVMLSSLQGCAVTGVKIDGVLHEFGSIPGVKEDVIEFVLNIKQVVLKSHVERPRRMVLKHKGQGVVTAGMIDAGQDVEVVNKDFVLCHCDSAANLSVEFEIANGKGYRPAEENKKADQEIGFIAVDSIFSPVMNVASNVEQARVGQKTDYDKLVMTIRTNGAVEPEDAMAVSARILVDQLRLFINFDDPEIAPLSTVEPEDELPFPKVLLKKVDELELSVRANNCLKNDDIMYIGELVQKSENDMLKTPNFGRKSLNEIKEQLGLMGLYLGMDVPGWPPENIDELARRCENPYK
ncbi:MAG: DNA-directed RNA polymerase subunit alpha [Rickettsiales bacterium]|jgi:DNA-directed RNA polymerase subunit alpha|nr:DNA-directed RNA polymerase subunit alpha [Rickettsiales bacterium]